MITKIKNFVLAVIYTAGGLFALGILAILLFEMGVKPQ